VRCKQTSYLLVETLPETRSLDFGYQSWHLLHIVMSAHGEYQFELGRRYARDFIATIVGDIEERYLPLDETGRVGAVCVRHDLNPDAPDMVLPGTGHIIQSTAEEFLRGGHAVPTFIKLAVDEWQHVGNYRVVDSSTDPTVIQQHQERAALFGRKRTGREKITMVLYLEPVGDYYDWRNEALCKVGATRPGS
jgi:hypothetical protein